MDDIFFYFLFHPFMPSGLFYLDCLESSISNRKGIRSFLLSQCFMTILVFNINILQRLIWVYVVCSCLSVRILREYTVGCINTLRQYAWAWQIHKCIRVWWNMDNVKEMKFGITSIQTYISMGLNSLMMIIWCFTSLSTLFKSWRDIS